MPVSSLAARLPTGSGPRLALLDARKDRVYALGARDDEGFGPGDVAPDEALAWFGGAPFVAAGEGAVVYAAAVVAAGGAVAPDADAAPLDAVLDLGLAGLADARPASAVGATYLREADAKRPGGEG